MDRVSEYGDMSRKEVLELLDQIESADEDIQEAETEAAEQISIKDEQSESDLDHEIEADYGDNAWRFINRKLFVFNTDIRKRASEAQSRAIKERTERVRNDKLRIQRNAFNQDIIQLSDPVPKSELRRLIAILVEDHTRMINKYDTYLNKRFTALLRPMIPASLKSCYVMYPNSMRMSKGFLYKAGGEYGQGLTFWAMPDIPFYFEQGTELELLRLHKAKWLPNVDKAVACYHEHLTQRSQKELKYASLLLSKGVKTYFDLLKYNPYWFEILFNDLKNRV